MYFIVKSDPNFNHCIKINTFFLHLISFILTKKYHSYFAKSFWLVLENFWYNIQSHVSVFGVNTKNFLDIFTNNNNDMTGKSH